jgi:cellulose 1,4-beta-cellobiosidase
MRMGNTAMTVFVLFAGACSSQPESTVRIASTGDDSIAIATALTLDHATLAPGDTQVGHIVYRNTTAASVHLNKVVIAMRPPGATNAGGPFDDADPQPVGVDVPPGGNFELNAARRFPTDSARGTWRAFATYQDAGGVWHDGPDVAFTVAVGAGCGGGGGGGNGGGGGGGGVNEGHVANPYDGAKFYVNPAWAASVKSAAGQTSDATLAAQMKTVAGYATAVWLDAIARIAPTDGTMGLAAHLDAALGQKTGGTPLTATFVIYDLPGRDCAALASNGEIPATSAGLDTYEHQYIDPIVALLSQPKYSGLRIVAVVEPDSLPNIVTNTAIAACTTAAPLYEQGVVYALNKLHPLTNVYTYLDSAHSGWLGWPTNTTGAAQEFAKVAQATTARFASIDGFITDTANYTPLTEPYMTAAQTVGGQPVQSAMFYQYNPDIDETDFAADMYMKLAAAGFPGTIGMLIDTSRNGWGGAHRPAGPSTASDVNAFVTASKIDRRAHRGLWCNVSGAGLGVPPQASPGGYPTAHLHAFVWIKPPGESDGTSAPAANNQGKKSDPMCDPTFTTSYGVVTGALPNSPLAGQWFATQFTQLVQNAYPAVH